MVVLSKQLYDQTAKHMACHEIFHPWSEGCISSTPKLFIDSVIGSTRFYSFIYLIQIIYQGKRLKSAKTWEKLAEYFIRSTVFGAGVSFGSVFLNCIFNGIGIQRNYIVSFLIPCTVNGLFIYLEPPNRRSLVINLFVNLLVDYWLRSLSKSGLIAITKSKQTIAFMVGSALLFFLMRLEGEKEKRTPLFWLYTPEKVKKKTDDSKNACPHEETCEKHIFKGTSMYFGIGLGINLAKLLLPRIRTPLKALSSFRGRDLKLALFFSSYIGIYRAVICYLCRKKGRDSALYALPAGFLAGLSMLFSPSTGMAIASLTGAFKAFSTILYEKKILPENIPLPELMYCICQGILFTARIVDSNTCPPYIVNLLDTVSRQNSKGVYERVSNRL